MTTPATAMLTHQLGNRPLRMSDGWSRVDIDLADEEGASEQLDLTALAPETLQALADDAGVPAAIRQAAKQQLASAGGTEADSEGEGIAASFGRQSATAMIDKAVAAYSRRHGFSN